MDTVFYTGYINFIKKEDLKLIEEATNEVNEFLFKERPFPDVTLDNYDPLLVKNHLHLLRASLEEKCKNLSSLFTYYEWLYHLRRLPSEIFSGRLKTTSGYDSLLALYIASFSKEKKNFEKGLKE
ncbi:Uncharacterised protein [Legionella steigerwaltii]|uniref:Uncharacterized protein n=1 Tax=Legionella steigerwaltii TaxID=460 RepID=A0A378LBL6_9GAMM|nr:hypothetical protein [Legionella steigerwaltii]KTD78544.1 hypothetical protein Lstg_1279 [Legionella steigerwaltii]STY24097.1 Uncharacterised protein [Legionella steigerwaltii]